MVRPARSLGILNSNEIGDEGCKAIADKIRGSSATWCHTNLELRGNKIGHEAKAALKAAAEAKGCTLRI